LSYIAYFKVTAVFMSVLWFECNRMH